MPRNSSRAVDKRVGARLKARRLTLGMSQGFLAEGLGVSFQQVQKYENGANRLSASRLQQASAILQVPMTFFFEGGPRKARLSTASVPTYVRDFMSIAEGSALLNAFMMLKTSAARRLAVRLIEDLAKDSNGGRTIR